MFPFASGRCRYVTFGERAPNGRLVTWLVLAGLMAANCMGCNALQGFQKKHENPVLGDVPRRVAAEGVTHIADAKGSDEEGDDGVTPVSGKKKLKLDRWEDWEDDTAIFNSSVAATVNGAPILNGDVLDRYSSFLISMREDMRKKKVPPSEYERQREALIMRDLAGHVQRRLLVESMRSSLKADQVKALNSHLDSLFEKEVDKLKGELKVSTRTELELELNKKGTTLQNVKDSFTTERMAMEYVAIKMDKPEHIDRGDLLEYYQSHIKDYEFPEKIEWEHVQISFTDDESKSKARDRMKQALQELADGASFAAVARKYSDGSNAKEGGLWEPMAPGALADTKMEEMLFQLPVGKLSSIYEGPTAWHLVRVISHKEAGRIPFGDKQDEIRQKLESDMNKKRPEKLFKKLFAEAVIESRFDMPQLQP